LLWRTLSLATSRSVSRSGRRTRPGVQLLGGNRPDVRAGTLTLDVVVHSRDGGELVTVGIHGVEFLTGHQEPGPGLRCRPQPRLREGRPKVVEQEHDGVDLIEEELCPAGHGRERGEGLLELVERLDEDRHRLGSLALEILRARYEGEGGLDE